jgi:ABC-type lipoprotein export system ATPase subunit
MCAALFKRKSKKIASLTSPDDGTGGFVRLRNLEKTYFNAAGKFPALKGLNADFRQGEFIAVIGRSGSGKSTLINVVTGIDRPTSGEIFVGDVAVHTLTENQMAVWRGRNVGVVFQFFQLLPMLSLLENIMLPMDFCNMYTPRERKKRAMHLLELVDMPEHANKLPWAISGGQQQRVAIARALANDPPLLVADEPTGNLDSVTAESVFRIFEDMISRGKTVLMVTHDSSLAQRVTRTVLLADGEIVNEYVARALPMLNHAQMLEATRKLKPMQFAAGETIIRQGTESGLFYIITKGHIEVDLSGPGGEEIVAARMGPGQYFGEIELLRGGKTIAAIRAAYDGPVELVALDQDTFCALLAESDATREALNQVVQDRIAENVAAGGQPNS